MCLSVSVKLYNVLGRANAKTVEPASVSQGAASGSEDPDESLQCPWHFQTPGPDMETTMQGTAGFGGAISNSMFTIGDMYSTF